MCLFLWHQRLLQCRQSEYQSQHLGVIHLQVYCLSVLYPWQKVLSQIHRHKSWDLGPLFYPETSPLKFSNFSKLCNHAVLARQWSRLMPKVRASSQIAVQVVSSISIPSTCLRCALRNSGSPGAKISTNPGASRLDLM